MESGVALVVGAGRLVPKVEAQRNIAELDLVTVLEPMFANLTAVDPHDGGPIRGHQDEAPTVQAHEGMGCGHGVAADELAGAVHRAVEVGLVADLLTAGAGRLFVDQAGAVAGAVLLWDDHYRDVRSDKRGDARGITPQ